MKIIQPTTLTLILLFNIVSINFSQSNLLSIKGIVQDISGQPTVDATVTLTKKVSNFEKRFLTKLDGIFEFKQLEAGEYLITVSGGPNFLTSKYILLSNQPLENVLLILEENPNFTIKKRVMVVGHRDRLDEIPGSAHFIDKSELEKQKSGLDDVHQVLRQIPGVNIQEEDGYGLRPNIGMRGTGVERSSKITLMEDGVLIAPAPYAAPSAYYFPTTGRMRALEVRKGSSQIKYGPQTNGGALNFISTEIPEDLTLDSTLSFGSDVARKGHINLGASYQNFGWLVETYQLNTSGFKELDGGGDTGFSINDYLAKFRFNTSKNDPNYQQLEFKIGRTSQDSDETYLGLTDADFSANPNRRYSASQIDNFKSTHEQYQVRHFASLPKGLDLTTTVYRNNFARNWYKLQGISGTKLSNLFKDPTTYSNQLDIARGGDSAVDALKVRANNREYYSHGIQSVLGFDYQENDSGISHGVEFGLRYHQDEEDRLQHEDKYQMASGKMNLTTRGNLGSQSNRISDADALSFSVQDEIQWGRWSIKPGMRYENIDLTRTDYSKTDPGRATPTKVKTNSVKILVPGVGINMDITPALRLFGGIHKGFSPPGPGSTEDTLAEESINYEFGFGLDQKFFRTQITTFYNDYSNMLGVDSLATGGTGTGDFYNGGKARVVGLELSTSADLVDRNEYNFSVPIQLSYTLSDGKFLNSFSSNFKPWGGVSIGDKFPYLSPHQFYLGIGVETTKWSTRLNAHYVSAMRTKAGQGSILKDSATDSYAVLNLSNEYSVSPLVRLFFDVRNITNNRYIVARRPYGARPGMPRLLMGGIKFNLVGLNK